MQTLLLISFLHVCLLERLDAIRCLSSSPIGNKVVFETKQCDEGVEHCMIALGPSSKGSEEYEGHSYGCWTWQKLKHQCPLVNGVCQILHTSHNDSYKTCCCYGDMCNNHTLEYLYNPNSTAEHMDKPTDRMASFGVHSTKFNHANPVLHSLHSKVSNHLVHIILPCLIGLVILLSIAVLLLRFCSSNQLLSRKFHTMNPLYAGRFRAPSRDRKHPLACLPWCPWTTASSRASNVPVCDGTVTFAGLNETCSGVTSGVGSQTCASKVLFDTCLTPPNFKYDPTEWSVMQLVSQSCEKDTCLGRGRFAQVWLAYIPTELLSIPIEELTRTHGSFPDAHTDQLKESQQISFSLTNKFSPTIGQWFKNLTAASNGALNESIPMNNLESAMNSKQTPENERLLISKPSFPVNNNLHGGFGHRISYSLTSASNGISRTLEDSRQPVAVKVFPPHESRAWTNELSIYRALQQQNWIRSSEPDDSLPVSVTEFHLNSHPNVIRMLGAGIIMDTSLNSFPLVVEYRLVMEFADTGSLRTLLSSGDWLSLHQFMMLSRDITSGLTFLHEDSASTIHGSPPFGAKPPVAHRDLKPENILIRADGSACLSDFGQAVIVDCASTSHLVSPPNDLFPASNGAHTGSLLASPATMDAMPKAGTLRYMAPEILDGAINFSGIALLRTDIYSLGLVLWELMSAVYLSSHSSFQTLPSTTTKDQVCNESHQDTPTTNSQAPPRRRHWMPYEKELGESYSSPLTLRQWVSSEKRRPPSNPGWYEHAPLIQMYRTITECWDPEPEARLTADCVLERLNALLAEITRRCAPEISGPSSAV